MNICRCVHRKSTGKNELDSRNEAIIANITARESGTNKLCATPFINTNRFDVNSAALAAGLLTVHGFREAVDSGALMSYGANQDENYRRAASYVDRIFKGAAPSALPVERPSRYQLAINLRTAKALDLTIPGALLAQADDVIE